MRDSILIVIWVMYVLLLIRAMLSDDFRETRVRLIWVQFFLGFLAVSLWGEANEQRFDRLLATSFPMAMFVKYLAFMLCCYLYGHMLAIVHDSDIYRRRALQVLLLSLIVALLLALYRVLPGTQEQDFRYVMIGLRDTLVMLYLIRVIIPGTLTMLNREQVIGMRIKQTAILGTAGCFLITAIGSAAACLITVFDLGDPYPASVYLQPWIYPGVLCMLVALVPFRWFRFLLVWDRLIIYFKVRRLTRRVAATLSSDRQTMDVPRWYQLLTPATLEPEIYRHVIYILDYYRVLEQADDPLYSELKDCIQSHTQYLDLTRGLAAIRCE